MPAQPGIAAIIARIEADARARANGYSCAEVFDGSRLVWLDATRTANGRIVWTLNERRIAKAAIPDALPKE